MKIGFVGVGKLGFPCALAIASRGHEVLGYDVVSEPASWLREKRYPHQEVEVSDLLKDTAFQIANDLEEVVSRSDIILCAVQTPHKPLYEGITRVPDTRADFDYSYLRHAVERIAESAIKIGRRPILVVISTVLPGTCERELAPVLGPCRLVYNPYFIAMGTVVRDFLYPEFVLVGSDDPDALGCVRDFYKTMTDAPIREMSIKSAELTKVIYNTFITTKINIANTVMEICERLGGNCDDVMATLALANNRITSSAYMRSGMGDSGGCHPRDGIALSWLADRLGMTYDMFGYMMLIRERQTEYLAKIVSGESAAVGLPIVILGRAFKAEINLTIGSCAILLGNMLHEMGHGVEFYDPIVDLAMSAPVGRAVYFVATDHQIFRHLALPEGSVVIDPWGSQPERPGVRTRRIGRGS